MPLEEGFHTKWGSPVRLVENQRLLARTQPMKNLEVKKQEGTGGSLLPVWPHVAAMNESRGQKHGFDFWLVRLGGAERQQTF